MTVVARLQSSQHRCHEHQALVKLQNLGELSPVIISKPMRLLGETLQSGRSHNLELSHDWTVTELCRSKITASLIILAGSIARWEETQWTIAWIYKVNQGVHVRKKNAYSLGYL